MAYTALNVCVDDDITETSEFNDVMPATLAECEEINLSDRRKIASFVSEDEMLDYINNIGGHFYGD
jgi:hypothetical protein